MARSGLIFNPETGLDAPDTAEIRAGVAQDWASAFFEPERPALDTEPTTPAGQLVDAEVAEIEAKNAELLFLSNQFNPKVAEGRWQDALGHIYFLRRKLDEPTVVTCRLTGLNGTVIPYGALVQSQTGHTLVCNRAVTIGAAPFASGQAETTFRVSENGPAEIPAHAVKTISTTIPGWDTVDNPAPGALGRDLETRPEFEARRAASVAANAHGSTGALFGAIAGIPGVLDVQVLENIGPHPVIKHGVTVPGHGVTVCVYGGEDGAIAEAIYNKKDNGADTGGNTDIVHTAADYHNAVYDYKIMRPTPVSFWIKVVLGGGGNGGNDGNGGVLSQAAENALKTALYQDFHGLNAQSGNARIGLASKVYASRFYCPALAALSAPDATGAAKNIHSIEIALGAEAPGSGMNAEAPGSGSNAYADVVNINGDQEPVLALENIILARQE